MKTFVAKYSNYLLILRSSRPAVPAIGQPSVPGLSIRFDGDALARVEDEETVEMILTSNAFKRKDIVLVEDEEKPEDPYKNRRTSFEPEHNILEIQHGAIVGNINPKSKIAFTPEQKKIVNDMIAETAKEMAREMAKEMLKSMAGKVVEEKKEEKKQNEDEKEEQEQDNKTVLNVIQEETKRRGRPPKNIEDKKEEKID